MSDKRSNYIHYTTSASVSYRGMFGARPNYYPIPGHSVTAELYYRVDVTPWLQLQPGLQYWHHPGGVSDTQDAWVTALKTVVTF